MTLVPWVISYRIQFSPSLPVGSLLQLGTVVSGIYVGSRADFEALNAFIEEHEIEPVVDRVFDFEDAPAAFDFMENGSYFGKIVIHPIPVASVDELLQRAAVGPIPGELMLAGGLLYNGACIAIALGTLHLDRRKHRATSTAGRDVVLGGRVNPVDRP